MNQPSDNTTKENMKSNAQPSFTPHELVEHHMQHPEEPITNAEMENLNLGVDKNATGEDEIVLTPEEKKSADELADSIDSDSTGMSYEADV